MNNTLLVVALALATTVTAQQSTVADAGYRFAVGELLVRPQPGADAAARELLAGHGLEILETDAVSGLLRVRVPAGEELQWGRRLTAAQAVRHTERNGIGQGGLAPNDTFFLIQWHLENTGLSAGTPGADINATEAWDVTTGWNGVTIAVLDTGIDSDHIEFAGRIDPDGYDFVNQDPDPEADHPHGSQVAGVMCANADNGFGVSGVDWHCNVLPIKVLDGQNFGSVFDLVQALNYCATQADVQVVSMSLINYPPSSNLISAMQLARSAGKILLACAGNGGLGNANQSYPGASPLTISIGATTNQDNRAVFSATGSALDFVAPGANIPTVVHNSSADLFTVVSGCSFATPITAGIVGLALARAHAIGMPSLSQDQVYDLLKAGAVDQVGPAHLDTPGRDDFFGWGRLDARLVVDAVDQLETCYAGTIGLGSSGPHDVVTIDGMATAAGSRTIRVTAGTSAIVGVDVPPTMPVPPPFPPLFLLWARFGDLNTPTPVQLPLGIGSMCFSPADPSTFVTFAEVAPWSAGTGPLPVGAVVSLQGVILADPMANIAITNSVTIEPFAAPAPTISMVDPVAAPAGATIRIHGTGFQQGVAVEVDGQAIPTVMAFASLIEFVAPAAPCDATLVVTNPDGQSASTSFHPTPTISSIIAVQGTPVAGGSQVLVIGAGFAANTTVTVGGNPMPLQSVTETVLSGTLPPGSLGPASVVVTTPNGCVTTGSITYTP